MKLASEDYRALAVIAALLISAGIARWLDRPRPILADAPQVDLVALAAAGTAQEAPRRTTGRAGEKTEKIELRRPEKTDPNRATVAELTRLPGVGPALAERIRATAAATPFRTQSDLLRVPGIGPAMIQKLAPLLTLPAGPPTAATPNGSRATPSPTIAGRGANPASPAAGPLDLNRATAADLERIRGVGTVLAAKILARRDSLGKFRTWEEVDAVTGVGEAMLARLTEAAVLRF